MKTKKHSKLECFFLYYINLSLFTNNFCNWISYISTWELNFQ